MDEKGKEADRAGKRRASKFTVISANESTDPSVWGLGKKRRG